MSNLLPIRVELQPNHPPILVRGRPIAGQEKSRIVLRATNPVYGSRAFVIKKRPQEMVHGHRHALIKYLYNQECFTNATEQQLGYLGDARYFRSFDMLSGFDYLPKYPDSYEFFTILTCASSIT